MTSRYENVIRPGAGPAPGGPSQGSYQMIGGRAIAGEPIPVENPRDVTLVEGPAGRPVLTYTNGLRAALLGYTRGGPSR